MKKIPKKKRKVTELYFNEYRNRSTFTSLGYVEDNNNHRESKSR